MASVKSQADRAGIAMLEVGSFDHPSPNAFATGWNKNAALVAVSTGLLGSMERGEVEAVWPTSQACHQRRYGHLGAYPGCREYLCDFPVAGRWLLGRSIGLQGATRPRTSLLDRLDDRRVRLRHSRNDNRDVVLRWREYRADEGGAELADRQNMINALKRLQASQGKPALPDEMAALAINAGRMQAFFAGHPPLEKRIEALQQNAR